MTFDDKRFSPATLSGAAWPAGDPERNGTPPPDPPPPGPPMGRIIEMAFSGFWVIKRQGALAEAEGRLCWPDRSSLERAAARAGIPLSDVVVHTGRLETKHR